MTPTELEALRALDPARPADPAAHTRPDAVALVERVLASTPSDTAATAGASAAKVGADVEAPGTVHVLDRRPVWWRPRSVRTATLLAAAAAVVGAVVLPNLGERTADAWTAVPQVVPRAQALAAAERCREAWAGPASEGSEFPDAAERAAMDLLLAERRGGYDLVVIGGGGWLSECMLDPDGEGALGALAPPDLSGTSESLPAEDVDLMSAMTALTDDGYVAAVFGRIGPDVMAVTLLPPDTEPVQATIQGGYFAAFWPASTPRAGSLEGVEARLVLRSGEVRTATLDMRDE